MFGFFRKKKSVEPPAAPTAAKEPVIQEPKVQAVTESTPTKTTVRKNAPKGSATRTSEKKGPAKKAAEKKGPAKKPAEKKAPARKASEKKVPEKKSAKTSPEINAPVGIMPKELKGFEKQLKDYALHSRMPFSAATANQVFTEYMAKTFRELGYKMVLIRDQDNGLITMLDREKGPKDPDDSKLKSKLVVKCVYKKRGSVGAEPIVHAQEEGARNRGDETWCITTTDFDITAVRKSKKSDARVRLYNGQRLYKEFLSRNERDL